MTSYFSAQKAEQDQYDGGGSSDRHALDTVRGGWQPA